MGLLDSIQDATNRGTQSAMRSVEKLNLNNRIKEIQKQRQNLAAQLGASLYEETRAVAEFRNGREGLYDGIAALDDERDDIQAQIAALDAEQRAEEAASQVYTCNICGNRVLATDAFCTGCGTKIVIAPAQPEQGTKPMQAVCPACHAKVNEGDAFCMACGAKITAPAPAQEAPAQPVQALCPVCHAKVNEGDAFCMACGAKVAAQA